MKNVLESCSLSHSELNIGLLIQGHWLAKLGLHHTYWISGKYIHQFTWFKWGKYICLNTETSTSNTGKVLRKKSANVCSFQNRGSRFRRSKREHEQLFLLSIFVTTSAIKLIASIDLPTTNLIYTNCNYVHNLFNDKTGEGSRASKYSWILDIGWKCVSLTLNNNLLHQLIVQSLIQPWLLVFYGFVFNENGNILNKFLLFIKYEL